MYSTYQPKSQNLTALAGHLEELKRLLDNRELEDELDSEEREILKHIYNDAGTIGYKLERFSLAARSARINAA